MTKEGCRADMLIKLTTAMAITFGFVTAALAGHANPWATADDVILERHHDTNQARSADTPGQDEMRGAMVQRARGKLEGAGSDRSGGSAGRDTGKSQGNGGGKGGGHGRNR